MEQLYQLYKSRGKDVLSGMGKGDRTLMRNGITQAALRGYIEGL